jgi:tRNA(fMet)-specific endonuclease VapC
MKVLIDTNRYRDFCDGIPEIVELFRTAEFINISFVSLAELRAGFLLGSAGKKNERILGLFLNSPRVHILCADENTTHHYARLFLQLRKQGTPIPTNDIWIAALVLQHDLALCSRDSHFDSLPQLPRV